MCSGDGAWVDLEVRLRGRRRWRRQKPHWHTHYPPHSRRRLYSTAEWRFALAVQFVVGQKMMIRCGQTRTIHRSALTLRYADGLPVPDVAEHLGRTVHATEALLVRARRAFRSRYEQGEEAGDD